MRVFWTVLAAVVIAGCNKPSAPAEPGGSLSFEAGKLFGVLRDNLQCGE